MALFDCKECGKRIDKAETCPTCGAPVPPMLQEAKPVTPELNPLPMQEPAKEYFLLIGGEQSGHFALADLQAQWRAKEISSVTKFAKIGRGTWELLASILDQVAEYRPEPAEASALASRPPGNESRWFIWAVLIVAALLVLFISIWNSGSH